MGHTLVPPRYDGDSEIAREREREREIEREIERERERWRTRGPLTV